MGNKCEFTEETIFAKLIAKIFIGKRVIYLGLALFYLIIRSILSYNIWAF
jgi:hypothetical protein